LLLLLWQQQQQKQEEQEQQRLGAGVVWQVLAAQQQCMLHCLLAVGFDTWTYPGVCCRLLP
jgi:hypothetical protein